jgi:hypothetical protein
MAKELCCHHISAIVAELVYLARDVADLELSTGPVGKCGIKTTESACCVIWVFMAGGVGPFQVI